ncbi:TetR/AcrR family transcriptional regulator [Nostoc sp. CMAA1605]|uniref:TetR/AcrR family transcriptional regulator n=1 Tax=Nostoc sp. CMAA1605 TaxID=2055159 RepID=UPI001F21A894|nr:TetR/AcrR family transcriptional regulator [Nostoc sp. CMAA1605]MCF4969558.1 TetR/AcrR family transcriptional regulator [Nostoc sp. CMAA1605]
MRKKKIQVEDKMDAILMGAIQEFLTHGYAATSMDRVTAAAGVSKTTVYSYFQDKEGLFSVLIKRLAQEKCLAALDAEFLQGEPPIVLRRLANHILDKVDQEQDLLSLVRLIIGESERFPELARIFVSNVDKPGIDLVSQYFAKHPELQLPDPQVAARIFVGTLIHFTIIQTMLHGRDILPMERDRLVDQLVNLMTINLVHPAPSQQSADTQQKSPKRKRHATGKFQMQYANEPKQLRSIRLTDTAWEKLAELADKHNISRSEAIEIFARQGFVDSENI